jgi:hypothetical protein
MNRQGRTTHRALKNMVETCRRLEVNPYEYLKSVIHEIAKDPSRAPDLTPRAWR